MILGLQYENAAMPVTALLSDGTVLRGWKCRTCGKVYFYYGAQQAAQYCHAVNRKCKNCGNRTDEKYRTLCHNCISIEELNRWLEKEEQDWDGETPLFSDSHNKYFFSAEELEEYLYDLNIPVDELRLLICENATIGSFDLTDYAYYFLLDDIEADRYVDAKTINNVVNEALETIKKHVWQPTQKRAAVNSLKKFINLPVNPDSEEKS